MILLNALSCVSQVLHRFPGVLVGRVTFPLHQVLYFTVFGDLVEYLGYLVFLFSIDFNCWSVIK